MTNEHLNCCGTTCNKQTVIDEMNKLRHDLEVEQACKKALALIVEDHEGEPDTLRGIIAAMKVNYARQLELLDMAERHGLQARHIVDDLGGGWISESKALEICHSHGLELD